MFYRYRSPFVAVVDMARLLGYSKAHTRQYLLSKPFSTQFFNRQNEMNLLLTSLKRKPTFHVVTGPVNSGKSLLIRKVEEKMKNAHVPVISINLRGISFNTVDTLVLTLEVLAESISKYHKTFQDECIRLWI